MMNSLLVEDDCEFALQCIEVMKRCGLSVNYHADAAAAKVFLLEHAVDVGIFDLMLPPSYQDEGLRLFAWAMERQPALNALLITQKQTGTTEVVANAMQLGAHFFLDKQDSQFLSKLEFQIKELLMAKSDGIFISHGHNELLRLKLKEFIQDRFQKTAIVLSDQPSTGLTIVEKLEQASTCCACAIILMTKDDETRDGGVRARQNVIHEIGFFQGKYGRQNVILLAERGVEVFSNISGIVRIEFSSEHFESAFEPLRIELEAVLQ